MSEKTQYRIAVGVTLAFVYGLLGGPGGTTVLAVVIVVFLFGLLATGFGWGRRR